MIVNLFIVLYTEIHECSWNPAAATNRLWRGRLCCLVKQTFSVDNISVCICAVLLSYPPVLYAALLCAQTLDRRFRGMLRLECESKDTQHDCIYVSFYSSPQNVLQLQCPQLLGLFTLHGGNFANVGLCVFWEETPSKIYYTNIRNVKNTKHVQSLFSFVWCAQNSNFCVWPNSTH